MLSNWQTEFSDISPMNRGIQRSEIDFNTVAIVSTHVASVIVVTHPNQFSTSIAVVKTPSHERL